jgi:hypothetical protein
LKTINEFFNHETCSIAFLKEISFEKSEATESPAAKQGEIEKIKGKSNKYLIFHIDIFNKIKDNLSIHKKHKIKKNNCHTPTIILAII